jgi:hypothetical protein
MQSVTITTNVRIPLRRGVLDTTLYIYSLGMRAMALLLSSGYQLLSEATPSTIVGTEGTIKVLLSEYQVYKCFIILNNCAIQNSRPFSDGFLVYFISALQN